MQEMAAQDLRGALERMTGKDKESELLRLQLLGEATDYQNDATEFNQKQQSQFTKDARDRMTFANNMAMGNVREANRLQTERNERNEELERPKRAAELVSGGFNLDLEDRKLRFGLLDPMAMRGIAG